MSEDTDYDDYEEEVIFEGEFQGEPIITKALIYSDGNIQIHQGSKSSDNKFLPQDIVGIDKEELQQILEESEEVTGDEP
jgi:hypothetical protein